MQFKFNTFKKKRFSPGKIKLNFSPSQILQESELSQYKNALQRWEEEKERQQNEFIITDKNLTGSQPILVEKVIFRYSGLDFTILYQTLEA